MSGYEQSLEMTRQRLAGNQFLSLQEIEDQHTSHVMDLCISETVHFSGFLNEDRVVGWPDENRGDDHAKWRRASFQFLGDRGVQGFKKAAVVFGHFDDEETMRVMPTVADMDDHEENWHSDQIDEYRSEIKRNGNVFRPIRVHPDMFGGVALRASQFEYPVMSLQARCSAEDLMPKLDLITKLSEDLPDVTFMISAKYDLFHQIENGSTDVIKLDI